MSDQGFEVPTAGQADWDASLNADLTTLERGYHVTQLAGMAINTGEVLWSTSGAYWKTFNPNSLSIFPMAMAFTAAASGDSLRALAWGIVRGLDINSPAIPGQALFVSALTPGVIVGSYAGSDRPIGLGLNSYGVLFNPRGFHTYLSRLSDVNTNGVADGKVLQWSDATSKWVPVSPAGGISGITLTMSATAGAAINSGHAIWFKNDRTVFHFNAMSEDISPMGLALTGGTGVGSGIIVLLRGIASGFQVTSNVPVSLDAYVSALTPGMLVGSYNGSFRRVGLNVGSYIFDIRPDAFNALPETLNSSIGVSAVTGSLHTFTVGVGRRGINRETVVIGNSADLVEIAFYSDAARSTLLYKTKSGGISVVGSFQDRALWPWDNTDAVNSASIYGTIKIMSAAAVGSDTISVQAKWDRYR